MTRKKAAPAPGRDPAKELRARAESTLSAANDGKPPPVPDDPERLLHELRVHQLELEMQNEELRRVQRQLEQARDEYTELYDFAPVGYLTLSRKGLIQRANLTAATLLGVERGALAGTPFSRYVNDAQTDQDLWYRHLREVLASPGTHSCELRLSHGGQTFHTELQSRTTPRDAGDDRTIRVVFNDVTARVEADAARQVSDARYQMLAEQAGVGIYHTAADGHCIYVNPRWCELTGLTPEQARGTEWARALHPEDREQVFQEWSTAVAERRPFELEYRFRTPGGVTSWLRGTARPLGDGGYVGTVTDVTAEREKTELLRASEERFQAVFENLGAGAVIYQPVDGGEDFLIRDMNQAGEAIARTSRDAAIGASVREQFPGVSKVGLFDALQRVARTRNPERLGEVFYQDPQRSAWIENFIYPLPTGEVVAVFEDVTARRLAAASLTESEARHRALFEHTLDPILLADDQGTYTDANPAALALLGCTRDEITGLSIWDLTPRADRVAGQEMWAAFRQAGRQEGEYPLVTPGGRTLQVEFRAVAQVLPGVHMSALRDVTEVRRLAQSLADSEARYRAIFEQAADNIFLLEPREDGPPVIADVNQAGAALHGHTREEMLGQSLAQIDDEENQTRIADRVRRLEAGETLVFETTHRKKDGGRLHLLATAQKLVLGGRPYYLAVEKDITTRRRLEAQLREREARLAGILANAPGAVYQYRQEADGSGGFSFLSARAEEVYGYPAEALQGDPALAWSMIHPDDLPAFQDSVARSAAELAPWRHEYRVRDPEGRVRWLVGRSTPEPGEPDGAIVWTGIVLDITARKQMETELRASEEEFRALFEGAKNPITLYDADAVVQRINPAGAVNLGTTPEGCRGRSLGEFLPEHLDLSRQRFREVIETGRSLQVEDEVRLPDGTRRFLSVIDPIAGKAEGERLAQVISYDVTASHQARKAKRVAEARFRQLAENSGIGVGFYDLEGRVQFFNREAVARLGGQSEDYLGRGADDIFGPEWGGRIQTRIQEVLDAGTPREYEDHYPGDAAPRWYLSTYSPVYDDDGWAVGVQILSLDVTERKEAEVRLRDSEERYRALFENETDAVMVFDAETLRFEEANPATCDLYGYPREEFLQLRANDISAEPEATRAMVGDMAARDGVGHPTRLQRRFRRKDGSEFSGEVSSSTFLHDNRLKAVGMVRDISERLQQEQKLQRHTQRLAFMRDLERGLTARQESVQQVGQTAIELFSGAVPSIRTSVAWFEPGKGSAVLLAVRGVAPARLGPGAVLGPADCREKPGLARGEPFTVEDLHALPAPSATERALRDAGARSYLSVPLRGRGRLLGTLNMSFDRAGAACPEERELLIEACQVLALALDNARLLQEATEQRSRLQRLAGHLDRMETSERKRLAQELHDRVGQNLTALGINLNIIRTHLGTVEDPSLIGRIDDSLGIVDETGKHIRDVMAELRPAVLDDYGLRAALRWLAGQFEQRTGIPTRVDGSEFEPRLGSRQEGILFRVVQESLTNVAKHAGSRRVWIEMSQDDGGVRLVVRDDGVGFDSSAIGYDPQTAGWGLAIMQERLRSVGGRLTITAAPGEGCSVECKFFSGDR